MRNVHCIPRAKRNLLRSRGLWNLHQIQVTDCCSGCLSISVLHIALLHMVQKNSGAHYRVHVESMYQGFVGLYAKAFYSLCSVHFDVLPHGHGVVHETELDRAFDLQPWTGTDRKHPASAQTSTTARMYSSFEHMLTKLAFRIIGEPSAWLQVCLSRSSINLLRTLQAPGTGLLQGLEELSLWPASIHGFRQLSLPSNSHAHTRSKPQRAPGS